MLFQMFPGPGLEIKRYREIKEYTALHAGTDLSKRDIADFETILSGDVNGNGIAIKETAQCL